MDTTDKPRLGRPPDKDVNRDAYLMVRVTPDEKAAVQALAEKRGQSISDYARQKLLRPVRKK